MPWYKVDDNLHSHPKARRAGLAAMGLWSLAGSHCMHYLTDGVVEAWFVESWPDGTQLAARLVKVGLWDEHADGWVFHDWDEYQPTAAQVKAERAATRERVAKHRKQHRSNGVTNGEGTTPPVPVPSPDFFQDIQSQSSSTRARVSTDAIPISAMTKKLAGQQGIRDLRRIVDGAHRLLGLELDADRAYRVCLHLLGKAKEHPRDATAYVLTCFEGSTEEVRDFIFKEVA